MCVVTTRTAGPRDQIPAMVCTALAAARERPPPSRCARVSRSGRAGTSGGSSRSAGGSCGRSARPGGCTGTCRVTGRGSLAVGDERTRRYSGRFVSKAATVGRQSAEDVVSRPGRGYPPHVLRLVESPRDWGYRTRAVRGAIDTQGQPGKPESPGSWEGVAFGDLRKVRMIQWMEFIEAPLFTRLLPGHLTDDEFRELQLYLASDPEAGGVIQGTGGFRKVRWADREEGRAREAACGS